MKVYSKDDIDVINNPINAVQGSTNTSNKFQFQNSKSIINTFNDCGFYLDSTSTGTPRKNENKGFQKHLMIFKSKFNETQLGDGNELTILVQNAHNGTSSVRFSIGIYRAVCANGLIVGDTFHEIRVLHRGMGFKKRIREAISATRHKFTDIKHMVRRLQNTELNYDERRRLAWDALRVRVGNKEFFAISNTEIDQLLGTRRIEDEGYDIYTVFNKIQENIMKGGFKYVINKDEVYTNKTLRKIKKGGDTDLKFNSGFWNVAMKYAA